MNYEPIDIVLERASVGTRRLPLRRRPLVAAPEAFDEVFASLPQQPIESQIGAASAAFAKPSLNAAPLLALSASLERQHNRLAALLREIEAGDRR